MRERAWRMALAIIGLMGAWPAAACAQATPAYLLEFRPMQKDLAVDYDAPADKAAIDACKVETVYDAQKKPIGYALRDGQGRILRKFIDTNGKRDAQGKTHLDQWSYFKDGFEVYREVDLNEDGVLDECRWLNSGGTKIALVRQNRVAGWRRISAEEASKVLVEAIQKNNVTLLESVLATPEELKALGVPAGEVEKVAAAAAGRAAALAALRKTLVGWDAQTVWSRFDGTMPHVIPADAGLKEDLLLYENAFIFTQPASGQGDPLAMAYLQAPEVIRIGETWKFVGLPRAINPKEPVATVVDGGLRGAIYQVEAAGSAPATDPRLKEALDKIAEHDKSAPGPDATKQAIAQFHHRRVLLLKDAIDAAVGDAEQQLNLTKQVVESLAAAYGTGLYQPAAAVLDQYAAQSGPIGPYAAYRKILAEYAMDTDQPGAEFVKVQKSFVEKLEAMLAKYPKCDDAPDALFQLASINEFNGEEDKAREYYSRLAQEFGSSQAGKKAAGALRRLDLVGRPLELSGQGLDGQTVSAAQARGRTLLVFFWTSGVDSARRDLPELVKLYQKHQAKGLAVISVNLDPDRETLDAFLKESPLPWAQIYEPGGMDSRLADEFGIISLPTMILVGADGKVVNRTLRNPADLDRLLEQLQSNAGGTQSAGLETPASR